MRRETIYLMSKQTVNSSLVFYVVCNAQIVCISTTPVNRNSYFVVAKAFSGVSGIRMFCARHGHGICRQNNLSSNICGRGDVSSADKAGIML